MSHIVQYEDEGTVKCEGAKDVAPTDVCKGDRKTRDEEELHPHKQTRWRRGRMSYIDRRLYLANISGTGLY
jgi:hypothetical protein